MRCLVFDSLAASTRLTKGATTTVAGHDVAMLVSWLDFSWSFVDWLRMMPWKAGGPDDRWICRAAAYVYSPTSWTECGGFRNAKRHQPHPSFLPHPSHVDILCLYLMVQCFSYFTTDSSNFLSLLRFSKHLYIAPIYNHRTHPSTPSRSHSFAHGLHSRMPSFQQ